MVAIGLSFGQAIFCISTFFYTLPSPNYNRLLKVSSSRTTQELAFKTSKKNTYQ